MNTETENKVVPKLRFSEFCKSGEWEEKALESVATFLKGKGISKSDISLNGIQPCIRYGELYTHYKEIINSVISFTNIPVEDLILSEAKDVIIPSSGETREDIATASCVMKSDIALGGDLNIIRAQIDGVFLAYYLTHSKKRSIAKLAQGDAVVHLYLSQLQKLIINFPKLKDEQQKIANCLSSLDELITAHNQKLEALKTHKKGLMQQLFPAEVETVPKLRFPEFRHGGNWNKEPLGEIVEIKGRIGYRGYTTADIVGMGEGAITLSPSNFDENGNLNFEKCTYITWDKYEESPEIQLEEGQTVLVKTASVGKTAYVKNLPEKATVNPQIVVLKPKKIHNRFLSYTIAHQNIQNQIRNCVGPGAIPNLSQESISNFEVLFPPDKENKEQQKISDCLSSLDELITAHIEKLQEFIIHKKGLMQGLFPSINESTNE